MRKTLEKVKERQIIAISKELHKELLKYQAQKMMETGFKPSIYNMCNRAIELGLQKMKQTGEI